jgi:hypothetical protein
LYDVPGGETRGGHAEFTAVTDCCKQSFDAGVDDGYKKEDTI